MFHGDRDARLALARLVLVPPRQIRKVRRRAHKQPDIEYQQRDPRLRVLRRGRQRPEQPRREDPPAVRHDQEQRERGRPPHVRRRVVRDPRLQRRRRAVRPWQQQEDRSVPDVAHGRAEEHPEPDDAAQRPEQDHETSAAVAVGEHGGEQGY